MIMAQTDYRNNYDIHWLCAPNRNITTNQGFSLDSNRDPE